MNANEFLRNKPVYRLDSRPSPRVRGSGFTRLDFACLVSGSHTKSESLVTFAY